MMIGRNGLLPPVRLSGRVKIEREEQQTWMRCAKRGCTVVSVAGCERFMETYDWVRDE